MCELVDGILVEKPGAFAESSIAILISTALQMYNSERMLGGVVGEQGMMKLVQGMVRAPEVSFVSWEQLPGGCLPDEPVPNVFPNLAVEVMCKGNTRRKMARKRKEYFRAGTSLVWIAHPKTRTVDVYSSPSEFETLTERDTFVGGKVVPGFKLPVRQVFANLPK